jgi:hypothetical protein
MASASSAAIANCPPFREAVESYLRNWTGLQLAVANQMGGQQSDAKAYWLIGVIQGFFADNEDLFPDEVAVFIAEIMDMEFNTVFEDGSIESLATDLCTAFRLILAGQIDELRAKIASIVAPNLSLCQAAPEVEVSAPPNASQLAARLEQVELNPDLPAQDGGASTSGQSQQVQNPEEEGWSVVTRGKRK